MASFPVQGNTELRFQLQILHHLTLLSAFIGCLLWSVPDMRAGSFDTPGHSTLIARFDRDSLRRAIVDLGPHRIEGEWLLTDGNAEIAIVRTSPATISQPRDAVEYRMILLSSPNRALRPGTIMGYVRPTAKSATYEARIFSSADGHRLIKPKSYTLRLEDDDSRLIFSRHRSTLTLNLWRIVPYIYRYSVATRPASDPGHGALRIFPRPSVPLNPVYL